MGAGGGGGIQSLLQQNQECWLSRPPHMKPEDAPSQTGGRVRVLRAPPPPRPARWRWGQACRERRPGFGFGLGEAKGWADTQVKEQSKLHWVSPLKRFSAGLRDYVNFLEMRQFICMFSLHAVMGAGVSEAVNAATLGSPRRPRPAGYGGPACISPGFPWDSPWSHEKMEKTLVSRTGGRVEKWALTPCR